MKSPRYNQIKELFAEVLFKEAIFGGSKQREKIIDLFKSNQIEKEDAIKQLIPTGLTKSEAIRLLSAVHGFGGAQQRQKVLHLFRTHAIDKTEAIKKLIPTGLTYEEAEALLSPIAKEQEDEFSSTVGDSPLLQTWDAKRLPKPETPEFTQSIDIDQYQRIIRKLELAIHSLNRKENLTPEQEQDLITLKIKLDETVLKMKEETGVDHEPTEFTGFVPRAKPKPTKSQQEKSKEKIEDDDLEKFLSQHGEEITDDEFERTIMKDKKAPKQKEVILSSQEVFVEQFIDGLIPIDVAAAKAGVSVDEFKKLVNTFKNNIVQNKEKDIKASLLKLFLEKKHFDEVKKIFPNIDEEQLRQWYLEFAVRKFRTKQFGQEDIEAVGFTMDDITNAIVEKKKQLEPDVIHEILTNIHFEKIYRKYISGEIKDYIDINRNVIPASKIAIQEIANNPNILVNEEKVNEQAAEKAFLERASRDSMNNIMANKLVSLQAENTPEINNIISSYKDYLSIDYEEGAENKDSFDKYISKLKDLGVDEDVAMAKLGDVLLANYLVFIVQNVHSKEMPYDIAKKSLESIGVPSIQTKQLLTGTEPGEYIADIMPEEFVPTWKNWKKPDEFKTPSPTSRPGGILQKEKDDVKVFTEETPYTLVCDENHDNTPYEVGEGGWYKKKEFCDKCGLPLTDKEPISWAERAKTIRRPGKGHVMPPGLSSEIRGEIVERGGRLPEESDYSQLMSFLRRNNFAKDEAGNLKLNAEGYPMASEDSKYISGSLLASLLDLKQNPEKLNTFLSDAAKESGKEISPSFVSEAKNPTMNAWNKETLLSIPKVAERVNGIATRIIPLRQLMSKLIVLKNLQKQLDATSQRFNESMAIKKDLEEKKKTLKDPKELARAAIEHKFLISRMALANSNVLEAKQKRGKKVNPKQQEKYKELQTKINQLKVSLAKTKELKTLTKRMIEIKELKKQDLPKEEKAAILAEEKEMKEVYNLAFKNFKSIPDADLKLKEIELEELERKKQDITSPLTGIERKELELSRNKASKEPEIQAVMQKILGKDFKKEYDRLLMAADLLIEAKNSKEKLNAEINKYENGIAKVLESFDVEWARSTLDQLQMEQKLQDQLTKINSVETNQLPEDEAKILEAKEKEIRKALSNKNNIIKNVLDSDSLMQTNIFQNILEHYNKAIQEGRIDEFKSPGGDTTEQDALLAEMNALEKDINVGDAKEIAAEADMDADAMDKFLGTSKNKDVEKQEPTEEDGSLEDLITNRASRQESIIRIAIATLQ